MCEPTQWCQKKQRPQLANNVCRNTFRSTLTSRQNLGAEGEALACQHLKKLGYEILDRNRRFGHKEIDIVARQGNELVFVEVKTRRSDAFGHPAEAVTYKKLRQLEAAAAFYLRTHPAVRDWRLDVIAITFSQSGGEPMIDHHQAVGEDGGRLAF